jgi:hypothetical protein
MFDGRLDVFHGDPCKQPIFAESSMSIYEKIHRALRDALLQTVSEQN